MKFELDGISGGLTIGYYDPTHLLIGGQRYAGPLVITPLAVHLTLLPARFCDLSIAHFAEITTLGAEIIIIGSGKRQLFLRYGLSNELAARSIAVESMDTAAACRCYNVLVSERRAVAAAIFPSAYLE